MDPIFEYGEPIAYIINHLVTTLILIGCVAMVGWVWL
jgi:hypothetical protein